MLLLAEEWRRRGDALGLALPPRGLREAREHLQQKPDDERLRTHHEVGDWRLLEHPLVADRDVDREEHAEDRDSENSADHGEKPRREVEDPTHHLSPFFVLDISVYSDCPRGTRQASSPSREDGKVFFKRTR